MELVFPLGIMRNLKPCLTWILDPNVQSILWLILQISLITPKPLFTLGIYVRLSQVMCHDFKKSKRKGEVTINS